MPRVKDQGEDSRFTHYPKTTMASGKEQQQAHQKYQKEIEIHYSYLQAANHVTTLFVMNAEDHGDEDDGGICKGLWDMASSEDSLKPRLKHPMVVGLDYCFWVKCTKGPMLFSEPSDMGTRIMAVLGQYPHGSFLKPPTLDSHVLRSLK